MPKLLSINVSLPKQIQHKGKTVTTGIFKQPVTGKVMARTLNLDGDGQADLIGHGGEMRAVYVYSYDNYSYWEQELGRDPFPMGQFGENFTVAGMSDQEIHVGDRFRIGGALFEVSQPRVPCYKLAIKMQVDDFYSRILKSGRLGFYFRVLEEGEVEAGDTIERVFTHPEKMTITAANALMYFDKQNYPGFRKALTISAFSPGWKYTFEDRLAKEASDAEQAKAYQDFEVTQKVRESSTITSFYLSPKDGKPIASYLPGQFLPLKLDIPGEYVPIFRTYSISNAPGAPYYRVTIKRELAPPDIPGAYPGVASNYFHDQVEVGSPIAVSNPRGKFYLNTARQKPIVLLSVGVGITPMLSMLEFLVERKSNQSIWFLHGARSGQEHAMGSYTRQLVQQLDNGSIHIRYSHPLGEDILGKDYEDNGRVDSTLVAELVGNVTADFYLCGPAVFMASLFKGLVDWGVSETNIHYEFFGPASKLGNHKQISQAKRKAGATECAEDITVRFTSSGITTQWNPPYDSLLELAEAEGLSPDYSCRSGICQTCQTRLSAGEVSYDPEPLQSPEEGTVLICCSQPLGDLTLEL